MKKPIIIALTAVVALSTCFAATACNKTKPIIGIQKFGTHASLDDTKDGILAGLKEGGIDMDDYEIVIKDDNLDASVSASNAQVLVNSGAKIIAAIATPSAQAAKTAADGKTNVVYAAVTNPESANLTGYSNICGSSDIMDISGQLKLIKAYGLKKVGILYTITEDNSQYQLQVFNSEAEKLGMTIVSKSIETSADVPAAAQFLISQGVDCISNMTDNTVVEALDTILYYTNEANIPIFGSEIDQVEKGCLASVSLDYFELGRLTGIAMAQILKGEKTPSDIGTITVSDSKAYYSAAVAAKFTNLTYDGSCGVLTDADAQ
jgi:putative ABC transport system substrate-binding protein